MKAQGGNDDTRLDEIGTSTAMQATSTTGGTNIEQSPSPSIMPKYVPVLNPEDEVTTQKIKKQTNQTESKPLTKFA